MTKRINYRQMAYDLFPESEVQLDAIWHTVSGVCRVPLETATNRCRKQNLVRARQLFFFFARQHSAAGWKEIGEYCGRDHTTAIHGYTAISDQSAVDKKLQNLINTIYSELSTTTPVGNVETMYDRQRNLVYSFL